MLPDCFGFPASLPTILAHSGVKGFSTQKLVWGSSAAGGGPESSEKTPEGTPFNVGVWVGPDGEAVLAGLNPGDYSGGIDTDLSQPLPPAPPNTALEEIRRSSSRCAQKLASPGAGRTAVRSEGIQEYITLQSQRERSLQRVPGSRTGTVSGQLGCPRRAERKSQRRLHRLSLLRHRRHRRGSG